MAKAKTGGGSKGTGKIPKTVAGVKIPKTLRDTGKAAVKLAQNPVARELLSAGLIAAAAAVTANTRARKAVKQGGKDTADALGEAATGAAQNASKLGTAIIDAAGNAAERFLGAGSAASGRSASSAPKGPAKSKKSAKSPSSATRKPAAKKAAAPKVKASTVNSSAAKPAAKPAASKKAKSGKSSKAK